MEGQETYDKRAGSIAVLALFRALPRRVIGPHLALSGQYIWEANGLNPFGPFNPDECYLSQTSATLTPTSSEAGDVKKEG